MTIHRRTLVFAGLALFAGALPVLAQRGDGPPPWAGPPGGGGGRGEGRGWRRRHRGDHDCALRALAEGRAKPLSEILPIVEKDLGGQAIDVELEHCQGRIVYEVKLLRPDGRLVEAVVDAMTGKRIEDSD
ncbi:MAG: PepSY domain-containing protein [Rhodoplanes sp.]|uniref:PepSY domain-containing protein n=1 Tax=Rhodoplanes sp. TaxID=1968906 RepID=UPI0018014000|nr:PepSY domain-containing protein [Rhodoplanes sp.]NVO13322.1 PepSY domain-containing protein [Rhodoplanes sp.]